MNISFIPSQRNTYKAPLGKCARLLWPLDAYWEAKGKKSEYTELFLGSI